MIADAQRWHEKEESRRYEGEAKLELAGRVHTSSTLARVSSNESVRHSSSAFS